MSGLELSALTLALAALVIVASSIIKGMVGFGFALIAAPGLLMLMDPKLVPVVVMPLSFIQDVTIVVQSRRQVSLRAVLPMVIAAAAGVPLGIYVLLVISPLALKLLISVVVLVFALVLLAGFTFKIRREMAARAAAGFAAGILQTATGAGGPPVALLNINQRMSKEAFRPALSLFFVLIDIMGLVSFALSGLLTRRTLSIDLVLLPAVAAGFGFALWLLPRIKQEVFRRLTILVIVASASIALVDSGMELARR